MISTETGSVFPVSSTQAKGCSRTSLFVLGAILALMLVGTYFDLTGDVEDFIKQTGGQLCFAYSSIEVYRAIWLVEDAVVAIGIVSVWIMIRAGYCRLSRMTFVFVLVLLVARWVWMGDCAP